MKKFVAILMMVVILMSVTAQAEWSVIKDWRVGTENGKTTYYVTYESESGGACKEFQVSKDVFETAVSVLYERKLEETRKEQIAEYQQNRGSWIKDACAWVSFWNPND